MISDLRRGSLENSESNIHSVRHAYNKKKIQLNSQTPTSPIPQVNKFKQVEMGCGGGGEASEQVSTFLGGFG